MRSCQNLAATSPLRWMRTMEAMLWFWTLPILVFNRLWRSPPFGIFLVSLFLASCGGGAGLAPIEPIVVLRQPADQVVVSGQSALFSVVVGGSANLVYRWKRDGQDIPGADQASYETPGLYAASDSAKFSVTISNGTTSTTSSSASVRVLADTLSTPATMTAITVTSTDSSIDPAFGVHLAFVNPFVSHKGKLFVFLSGTGARPIKYTRILRAAADNGFHVVGLAYSNQDTVQSLCQFSTDLDCHARVREETFRGTDDSRLISVDVSNSMDNRLVKVLQYLQAQRPSEGWGNFLTAEGGPVWAVIRMAGHSQGGGLAAYVATKVTVDRACSMSSPADFDEARGRPASWVTSNGATPSSRLFGFSHRRDGIVPWSNVVKIWTALGLGDGSQIADVDTGSVPFSGLRMLQTNLDPGEALVPFHNFTAVDDAIPLDAQGNPKYLPVWQYACFR